MLHVPTIFKLTLSGFRPHISVWIEENEVHYNAEGDVSTQKVVIPSAEQWFGFWKKCETLGMWSWHQEYMMGRWDDGYKWGIEIEYEGRYIKACGVNMYPGEIALTALVDADSYRKTQIETWRTFTTAVEDLLGGLPFVWSDWRSNGFPTHGQTIRNQVSNDLKRLPAEPRDGMHNDLAVSIVDSDNAWFQLRINLPKLSVFADTDHTMTPGALSELDHAAGMLLHEPETVFVDFDNESEDTARIIMMSDIDGMTRLVITDWCEGDIPPRLDIKAPTAVLVRRFRDAVSNYAQTTDVELRDLVPTYYL